MINLRISPRFVKQEKGGLRPLQRQALEAIKNSEARLTFVEAPVKTELGLEYICLRE